MYDIFFLGDDVDRWNDCKSRYPHSQKIEKSINITDLQKMSFTSSFWVIWDDVILNDFDITSYRVTKWDDQYTHVFKNGQFFDGICLLNKRVSISNKEFQHRFFINKKEVEITASHPVTYEKFYLSSYDDYLNAFNTSKTEMFWGIFPDLEITKNFSFEYYVPTYDSFHRNITHIFKNANYYDGVCLFSKKTNVSKKEFDNRFFINKKEVEILSSTPVPFDKFLINNFDDYLNALKISKTEMFWGIFPDLILEKDFNFDYYVPKYDSFHRNITHVFKNGIHYDGICLFSNKNTLSKRELEYRFFANKKEVDIIASHPRPYDVVFISYFEKYAEENFNNVKKHLLPGQKIFRINGIKGIHNAHREAAGIVESSMFWVVDADASIKENFLFDYHVVSHNQDMVHVWRSINPINDLEYGNGGVKLLPKNLTLAMSNDSLDMTTSISYKFMAVDVISNVNLFNTDPYSTWRSAFRECVKLSAKIIKGQVNEETEDRLDKWCTLGQDRPYGKYAIQGAIAGRDYGLKHKNNPDELNKINDYTWLEEYYSGRYSENQ